MSMYKLQTKSVGKYTIHGRHFALQNVDQSRNGDRAPLCRPYKSWPFVCWGTERKKQERKKHGEN